MMRKQHLAIEICKINIIHNCKVVSIQFLAVFSQSKLTYYRDRGATFKVVGLPSESKLEVGGGGGGKKG